MSTPTSPPLMSPPGWYPDPEMAWTWRWWDGGRWTDLRAPQLVPPERDPYSFSAWFEQSVDEVKAATRRVGVLLSVVWLTLGIVSAVVVVAVFNSSKGREIRSLLDIDSSFGSFGSRATIELTDDELDRLRELAVDVVWSALPWLLVLLVIGSVVALWGTALLAQVTARRNSPAADGPESRTDEAADALRRVPAVFASSVAVGAALVATLAVCLLPLLVAIGLDAGGGAVAVAAVFGLIAALALGFSVWVRLSLAPVIAALGGHRLGLRRSWRLTQDHAVGVAGRLLVLALIAGAVTAPLSLFSSLAPALGVLIYVVVVVVVQALAAAAAALVSVPAQVVLVRHLTDRHAPRLGT